MKKKLSFFNSVQTLIGLFFLILSILCLIAAILLAQSNEEPFLKIVGCIIMAVSAFLVFLLSYDHFKKAYRIITDYTKEQRDNMGDLLIGRVQGGKYL